MKYLTILYTLKRHQKKNNGTIDAVIFFLFIVEVKST
jgi:hypothetical protein